MTMIRALFLKKMKHELARSLGRAKRVFAVLITRRGALSQEVGRERSHFLRRDIAFSGAKLYTM